MSHCTRSSSPARYCLHVRTRIFAARPRSTILFSCVTLVLDQTHRGSHHHQLNFNSIRSHIKPCQSKQRTQGRLLSSTVPDHRRSSYGIDHTGELPHARQPRHRTKSVVDGLSRETNTQNCPWKTPRDATPAAMADDIRIAAQHVFRLPSLLSPNGSTSNDGGLRENYHIFLDGNGSMVDNAENRWNLTFIFETQVVRGVIGDI